MLITLEMKIPQDAVTDFRTYDLLPDGIEEYAASKAGRSTVESTLKLINDVAAWKEAQEYLRNPENYSDDVLLRFIVSAGTYMQLPHLGYRWGECSKGSDARKALFLMTAHMMYSSWATECQDETLGRLAQGWLDAFTDIASRLRYNSSC